MGRPELRRSGHTPVDPDHAASVAETRDLGATDSGPGPVPPENQPGHHPRHDQDKPVAPGRGRRASRPPTPPGAADEAERFAFAFDDARIKRLARLVGVSPGSSYVQIEERHLTIRFGRWTLRTALGNVADTTTTGPYQWWKVAGPPRVSLADRGVTFATSASQGLCISFHEPVPAVMPTSLIRHPAATVTVNEPDELAEALEAARARAVGA